MGKITFFEYFKRGLISIIQQYLSEIATSPQNKEPFRRLGVKKLGKILYSS